MRYQIARYECPETEEKVRQVLEAASVMKQTKEIGWVYVPHDYEGAFTRMCSYFCCTCEHCGAELYGVFKYYDESLLGDSIQKKKESWLHSCDYDYATQQRKQQLLRLVDAAIERENAAVESANKSEEEARAAYERAVHIEACPICGAALRKENGLFKCEERRWMYDKSFDVIDDEIEREFKEMPPLLKALDRKQAESDASAYGKRCDLPAAAAAQAKASEFKEHPDALKQYILHLIHLENNIYSLEQQLSALYHRRAGNHRVVVCSTFEPAFALKAELEALQSASGEAAEALDRAKLYQPDISVAYPPEPGAPVLGKPGLFNKKKVLAENEALTAKYEAEMDAYRKEVRRCDEEKARLIAEKRAAVIGEAQEKLDAAQAALHEAESSLDDKIKALETRPAPAKGIEAILDREISETEELLKKTIAVRNELYACDVIFGKYRNAVALSSIYEYLMSGRCASLEGADGAYNIYESEIRANRVIAQLDTVISSLENIKQNQYMMYEELCKINDSLDSLNDTMDRAVTSIRKIESSTDQMSKYMEHISQNSDVIAHNTAVTAYYSKVNAELTNALGYMAAF